MKRSFALVAVVFASLGVVGCPHPSTSTIAGTAGARATAEAIDADPLALLPSGAIGVATVDAKAFFASSLGADAARLTRAWLPLGESVGFVPERDLRRVVVGAYAMTGADGVVVAVGDFHPDKLRAAAEAHATTPVGVPIVRSTYADTDLYTAGTVGFAALTEHTLLVGNETGMRRALDRVRDGRLARDVPTWITDLVAEPKASFVVAADLQSQARTAELSRTLAFLGGVKSLRAQGNFEPPGVNVVGAFTYPDAARAEQAKAQIDALARIASVASLLAAVGISSPVRDVQTQLAASDVQVAAKIDAAALVGLASRAASFGPPPAAPHPSARPAR